MTFKQGRGPADGLQVSAYGPAKAILDAGLTFDADGKPQPRRANVIGWNPAHLPMQKLPKIRPSRSSLVTSPVISPSCFCASVSSCATSSPA